MEWSLLDFPVSREDKMDGLQLPVCTSLTDVANDISINTIKGKTLVTLHKMNKHNMFRVKIDKFR
jgi:hypothetical protein